MTSAIPPVTRSRALSLRQQPPTTGPVNPLLTLDCPRTPGLLHSYQNFCQDGDPAPGDIPFKKSSKGHHSVPPSSSYWSPWPLFITIKPISRASAKKTWVATHKECPSDFMAHWRAYHKWYTEEVFIQSVGLTSLTQLLTFKLTTYPLVQLIRLSSRTSHGHTLSTNATIV